MQPVEIGNLIRRHTDGTVGVVVEVGSNFVKADMPRLRGGVYKGISVKDYEVVSECQCCYGTGFVRKESSAML